MDCDEPAGPGEAGRIVITDLFNYAFPLIRYDTGDIGVMEYGNDDELPRLKEIYGRERDCVYNTVGELISQVAIKVEIVEEIPITLSNKRRAVICKYKK